MPIVTPLRLVALLAFYAALFVVIRSYRREIDPAERKTFWLISGAWATIAFASNYLLYLAGVMSFLPWVNNFVHTFLWIGGCLAWLYFAVRDEQPMWVQFVLFATFSLIVKYAEQLILGTWEMERFFFLPGNTAYVLGWSLVDGLIPIATHYGLRLISNRVPGLVPT